MTQKEEALRIIEDSLKELESPKGSVLSGVQKLARASKLIDNSDVNLWCAIQLGEPKYTKTLQDLIDFIWDGEINHDSEEAKLQGSEIRKNLKELNLNQNKHFPTEELRIKYETSGGGYSNIGFIEEKYKDLIRLKDGNDGTYYKNNLHDHINYVKRVAHSLASEIFSQLKFSGTVKNCFDILKIAVDDKLLDLNPILTEKLMLAFKSVASSKEEEWSQALTTCRRLIESLADELYPSSDEKHNGRALGPTNYVNRIWAYMDQSIVSDSNKELAKSHVDFLGSWLEKVNKISNKGVHSTLGQIEATKAVFHTYLVIADILEIKNLTTTTSTKKNINDATLDEIEVQLCVTREKAKAIFKIRIEFENITLARLKNIKGIGKKTLAKVSEVFEVSD